MENSGYSKIDDYLMGRLKGKALKDFEQQLQLDEDFAKTVDEQKQAIKLFEKINDLKMKEEVQEIQLKYKSQLKPLSIIRNIRPWFLVTVGLFFLIIAIWLFNKKSHQQLFNAYYVAYDINFGERNSNNQDVIKLSEATQYYRQKEFKKALVIFKGVTNVADGKLQLATGISQLEIGKFEQAIESFNQLVIKKDPVFQYHGIWYIAMTYLKSGDLENCKIQLQKLVDSKDTQEVYNQSQAKALLGKI